MTERQKINYYRHEGITPRLSLDGPVDNSIQVTLVPNKNPFLGIKGSWGTIKPRAKDVFYDQRFALNEKNLPPAGLTETLVRDLTEMEATDQKSADNPEEVRVLAEENLKISIYIDQAEGGIGSWSLDIPPEIDAKTNRQLMEILDEVEPEARGELIGIFEKFLPRCSVEPEEGIFLMLDDEEMFSIKENSLNVRYENENSGPVESKQGEWAGEAPCLYKLELNNPSRFEFIAGDLPLWGKMEQFAVRFIGGLEFSSTEFCAIREAIDRLLSGGNSISTSDIREHLKPYMRVELVDRNSRSFYPEDNPEENPPEVNRN
ncbi:hypothetical protein HY439_01970 [Candidatus Microgenomates bacterium]|nr:hypothetical protein [Candidatus Microgenomates bacterium]